MWNSNGLATDVWFILILDMILPSLLALLDPWYLERFYMRYQIRNNNATCKLTQSEANEWFEGPPFDIAQKYANNLHTVLVSLFFLPIVPFGIITGFISLLLVYMTEKFLLLRVYNAPVATGTDLNFGLYRFFDIILIIFSVSLLD